jgi:6-phosphogluconolactonase (cycloisomerase 2 family)
VVNANANTISQYTIGTDGALTAVGGTPPTTGTFPVGVTVDPTGRYAYVTNLGNADGSTPGASTISQYTIGVDGTLTPMTPASFATGTAGTAGAGTAAWSLTVDPTGSYAYVVNRSNSGSFISQYAIGPTGALSPLGAPTVAAAGRPHFITIDPTGTYAYVANYDGATVSQYTIAGGALTFTAAVATGAQPFAVTIDPAGHYAYVTNYNNAGAGSVSQYSIGATDGVLTPMTPPTVTTGNQPWSVFVDPAGLYAYVTNFTDNTISQYTIGASDGTLTAMSPATIPTDLSPQFMAMDPWGRYLYAVDYSHDRVSQYTVGTGGALASMGTATVNTGLAPFAIAITR